MGRGDVDGVSLLLPRHLNLHLRHLRHFSIKLSNSKGCLPHEAHLLAMAGCSPAPWSPSRPGQGHAWGDLGLALKIEYHTCFVPIQSQPSIKRSRCLIRFLLPIIERGSRTYILSWLGLFEPCLPFKHLSSGHWLAFNPSHFRHATVQDFT